MESSIIKYADYSLEEFIVDEFFQRWVKHPDEESNLFWQTYVTAYPYQRQLIEDARQVITDLAFEEDFLPEEQITQVWKDIIRTNDAYDNKQKKVAKIVPAGWFSYSYRLAAVFVGILFIAAAAFIYQKSYSDTQYRTQFGETKTIILPDSSTVMLNANSSLTFSSDWNEHEPREVWLAGEAFFSVIHTRNHQKFLVHTSESFEVEVLGTEFNVYQRKSGTRVILNSGKVKLNFNKENQSKQVIMKPGELVELTPSSTDYVKKEVDASLFSAWTQKELIFSDTPIQEIVTMLEETYGLTVEIRDKSILDRKISGSVPSENLESLLFALSESLNYHITKQDNQIVFQERAAK